jgi:gliding motility-associated lipoprotein GldH
MFRPYLFSLIGLLLSSCTGNTLYHHYKSLPAEGWERSDTVCFEMPKAEEDIDGSLFIGLRTVANVGIQDIVLAVEQCSDSAGVLRRDTIRYTLNDAEGNALAGGINCHQYENMQLPFHIQKGEGRTVRIYHLMTRELVPGIMDVGIRVSNP